MCTTNYFDEIMLRRTNEFLFKNRGNLFKRALGMVIKNVYLTLI